MPLPLCCDKIAKVLAAAWNTSFEEECISMESITALSIGNLSQRDKWPYYSSYFIIVVQFPKKLLSNVMKFSDDCTWLLICFQSNSWLKALCKLHIFSLLWISLNSVWTMLSKWLEVQKGVWNRLTKIWMTLRNSLSKMKVCFMHAWILPDEAAPPLLCPFICVVGKWALLYHATYVVAILIVSISPTLTFFHPLYPCCK